MKRFLAVVAASCLCLAPQPLECARGPGTLDDLRKAKASKGHPNLGRYHGFTATGITLDEFNKIISSLRPIRP